MMTNQEDRFLHVDIEATKPGVVLCWGDGSITFAMDGDGVDVTHRNPLMRRLMATRLRYIADEIEKTEGP